MFPASEQEAQAISVVSISSHGGYLFAFLLLASLVFKLVCIKMVFSVFGAALVESNPLTCTPSSQATSRLLLINTVMGMSNLMYLRSRFDVSLFKCEVYQLSVVNY